MLIALTFKLMGVNIARLLIIPVDMSGNVTSISSSSELTAMVLGIVISLCFFPSFASLMLSVINY